MTRYLAKTPERVELAAELRAEGMTYREIGELLGVRKSAVHEWLNDSDGSKQAARRERHRLRSLKPCVDCGKLIDGTHVTQSAERCRSCAYDERKVWTREAIVLAMQEWAAKYGEPPSSPDWNSYECRAVLGDEERAARFDRESAAGTCPTFITVFRTFGAGGWNAALVAAGFEPRPAHGGGGNELRRRDVQAKAA